MPPRGDDLASYLRLLGYDAPPPPTLDTLTALHRAHLDALPYDNLDIMLGRPPPTEPAAVLARIAWAGRAGYCFHHNGALGALLTALGFEVETRHGHVYTDPAHRGGTSLNHLVLLVRDQPSADNPRGDWWPDVGLGDAFREPVALVAGELRQHGFDYALTEVGAGAWSFVHDPRGTFTGIEVRDLPLDVAGAHLELSTAAASPFTAKLVVQWRQAGGVDTIRGAVLTRLRPTEESCTDLTTYDDWRAALTDVTRLSLEGVGDDDLRALWSRVEEAHHSWDAAGRP